MRALIVISALALLGVGGAGAQGDRMRVVDPLGGTWVPVRLGALAVPAAAEARLFFNGGVEYSTQAGCGNFGGFYSLDGDRISGTRSTPASAAIGRRLGSRLRWPASSPGLPPSHRSPTARSGSSPATAGPAPSGARCPPSPPSTGAGSWRGSAATRRRPPAAPGCISGSNG
jgi:hypothetical protein